MMIMMMKMMMMMMMMKVYLDFCACMHMPQKVVGTQNAFYFNQ